MKACGMCIFLTTMILVNFSVVFAQQDDSKYDSNDYFTAELTFDSPMALEADETYDFEFTITNTTSPGDVQRWIKKLEMFMPDPNYTVNENFISAPDAIHDGEWVRTILQFEVDNGSIFTGIRWQYSGYVSTEYSGGILEEDSRVSAKAGEDAGDIPEGDSLSGFAFRSTTDHSGTDGFNWAVWADDGSIYVDEACVVPENCGETDDDYDVDDDDLEGYCIDFCKAIRSCQLGDLIGEHTMNNCINYCENNVGSVMSNCVLEAESCAAIEGCFESDVNDDADDDGAFSAICGC